MTAFEDAALSEASWRAAVEGVMRYEGYTDEEIAEAYGPVTHTDGCTDNGYPFGYDCTDEEGRDQHPLHTRSCELDETYRLFFEESDLARHIATTIAPHLAEREKDAARDVLDGLAAHDARVKAAALRDTAEYLDRFEGPGDRTSAHDQAGRDIIRLIRVRADETEKETGR